MIYLLDVSKIFGLTLSWTSGLFRDIAWNIVLYFIPATNRYVNQDNVDDHVGSVALVLIRYDNNYLFILIKFIMILWIIDTIIHIHHTIIFASCYPPVNLSPNKDLNLHIDLSNSIFSFLLTPPMLLSCAQIIFASTHVPVITTVTTFTTAFHFTCFPLLLRITGKQRFLCNYACLLLLVMGVVNCLTSGAGFWTFNCTPLPVPSRLLTQKTLGITLL